MKKVIFVLFALAGSVFQLAAQTLPLDPETKKVTYFEVIDVDGASKDLLYKRAKNFGTIDKSSILKDDTAAGIYSTKGKIQVSYPAPMKGMNHSGVVEYTMTLFLKDGKYKYVLTDFIHVSDRGNGGNLELETPACGKYTLSPSGWSTVKRLTDEEAKKIVEAIKNGMRNPSKNSATSTDW